MTAPTPSEDDAAVKIIAGSLAENDDLPAFAGWQLRCGASSCLIALRAAGFVVARESVLIAERDAALAEVARLTSTTICCDDSVPCSLEAAAEWRKTVDHYEAMLDDVQAQRDAALAERDAARAKGEWQPIETAPKDGTIFLAVVEDAVRLVGRGKTSHVPIYGWTLRDQGAEDTDLCEPTLWQLLPGPPDSPALKGWGRGRSQQWLDGRRNGTKRAVAFLHEEAARMNDPHAKAVLNSAAFGLGKDAGSTVKGGGQP